MHLRTADRRSERRRRYAAGFVVLTLALLSGGPLPGATARTAEQGAPAGATKLTKDRSRPATLPAKAAARVLADRYVVELVDGASPADLARDYRGSVSVRRRYTKVFTGFAARMPAASAEVLRSDPRVVSVEADIELTLSAAQTSPTWGLDRMDQRHRPLDETYVYDTKGSGVSIYVVDTGVYANHNQFGDRVRRGYNATGGSSTEDCVGHGTHVAGTAAGATFGVAKRARIIPIRVLNCQGAGTKSQLIAGLDWLVRDHRWGEPAVANLSLGGAASRVVDRAVNRVIDDGVTVVAAAGNEGDTWWGNACDYSPARVKRAITVGATNRYDHAPLWSNFGPCLDLFAPGAGIRSASPWGRTATATESGTSMAAPFVTGAAARLLDKHPNWGPRRVADVLKASATPGIVAYAGQNTTQSLLYLPAQVPTRIGASLSDSSLARGDLTHVRATLRNAASRRPIPGKTLRVYQRPTGTSTWHHLATRTTNFYGRIAVGHRPLRPTQYEVRHGPTSTTKPARSDVVKAAVGAKARTVLGLSTASGVVEYEDAAVVWGTLRRAYDGRRLQDKRVELFRRAAGTSRWRFITARRTNHNGRAEFHHYPGRNSEYQLRYSGNSSLLGSRSAARAVQVRFAVTGSLSPTSALAGQQVELTGQVQPVAKDPADRRVRIHYLDADGSTLRSVGVDYDNSGDFTKIVLDQGDTAGSYRFQVRAAADASNAAGVSDYLTAELN